MPFTTVFISAIVPITIKFINFRCLLKHLICINASLNNKEMNIIFHNSDWHAHCRTYRTLGGNGGAGPSALGLLLLLLLLLLGLLPGVLWVRELGPVCTVVLCCEEPMSNLMGV